MKTALSNNQVFAQLLNHVSKASWDKFQNNAYWWWIIGRDPFNQNSDRSDREKRTTSKGGPVFSKLFRLDRTDPLSFGPKFPEILVEWIAPIVSTDGLMQMTRYNVGSSTHRGTNSAKRNIKWYVQTPDFIPKPTYSHQANGHKVQGSFNLLKSSVQNGEEI